MLYKFLPPARERVLLDGLIRFTQVAALNDPFESMAIISGDQSAEDYINKNNAILNQHANSVPGFLDLEGAQDLLKSAQENMARWTHMRMDPGRIGRDVMMLINKTLGILSLSRNSSNSLMWSHYAQAHQGFVVGFDESNSFFNEPDRMGDLTRPFDVLYKDERVDARDDDPEVHRRKLLCQKSVDWEYEEEVRIFRSLEDNTSFSLDQNGYPIHLFHLDKTSIKEIIFGANSSAAMRQRILGYVRKNSINVKIYLMRTAPDSFKLRREEIHQLYFNYREDRGIEYNFLRCHRPLPFDFDYLIGPSYYLNIDYGYTMPSAAAIINGNFLFEKFLKDRLNLGLLCSTRSGSSYA